MTKSAWLLGAAFFTFAAPGFAQDTQSASSTAGPAASDASDQVANAGDIIVTATRRAEALSDVPIAVSAVSAESLQNSGANDIRQLNQLAPSLLVSSTGSEANGSARIRGIGTVGDNPGLESSVAVFVDGVYRSRSGIGLNELGEVDRIEVLRGPQGTLFGRNASAGLIHIITKKPSFDFGGYGEFNYGNYNSIRAAGAVTGPITKTLAARLDAVYVKRDGFYHDVTNNTDVNDRDRYFVRGQLLYEPSDDLSVRIIGDYTHRDEKCCGAVYIDQTVNPANRNLLDPTKNTIIQALLGLGEPAAAFSNPFSRNIYPSPGRSYRGITKDWGVSGEVNWKLGEANLTSITAYRDYKSNQGSDTDYSFVDILYRAPGNAAYQREFRTFSQELRLQGSAFDKKLDWLIGGYFANEKLDLTDNLKFGTQYGRFATCRLVGAFGFPSSFFSPGSAACLSPTGRAVLSGQLAAQGIPSPFGAGGPAIVAGFDRLDAINNVGDNNALYRQRDTNFAFFTHNIFHLTDTFDITLGARYTHDRKKFGATFNNNNTICPVQQANLTPLLTTPLSAAAGALINLSCQGNATSELNGVSISDRRGESEFTGTAVVSWKPSPDWLVYASYSRGYKAGGFNLDRSALKPPIFLVNGVPTTTFAAAGGAQSLVGNLQFAQETNDAYELGFKYSSRMFSLNVAAFHQRFSNFQLNTFNGSVFLVQNVNGCSQDLGGADRDQDVSPLLPNFNAAAKATGSCPANDVGPGVLSTGVEIESAIRPTRDVSIGLGLTVANTHYRQNLVGNASGVPLDPALRELPGRKLSNAPEAVATGSFTWTPPIGDGGITGLLYVDGRVTSDYNTGSDLFPQKGQDGFAVFNGRIGIRGPHERWAVEVFVQNMFNKNYAQVAFNTPFQAGRTIAPFTTAEYPGAAQIFSAFLAEPRTYGVTVRTRF
ncbi:putative TonB-dependent receptor [Sphingomonas changbaiensis NBRC 104936]|uniref:Putative TonB-dependent receptor n=1 Tax=Sphingomonas changbaiensis NBRC 104936 TaxID=1219043 RepID=A0A0E9MR83_9SPHN|nr:TonB-dependent receptor [Sphingomonas changbaiensis]GAO40059.1 putative TonB-dependent receptor [Sphingomonas changbaiensis NBRC 104936]